MTPSRAESPVLAVDVGGTTIKAAVIAGDRTVAAEQRPTPRGAAAVDAIADLGAELVAAVPGVEAAGVALPGIVDRRRGVGVLSANIGWRDAPVAEPLAHRWGIPVRIDHDVTIAGVAEWRHGAGRGVDDFVYVSLGTGISATLICAGRLVRGGIGQAGEVGHVVVRPDGPACGCGARGCLEAVASAAAIRREYDARSGASVAGAAEVVHRAAGTAPPVAAAAEQTADPPAAADPTAAAVLADAIAALADGLAGVVQLLAPARIALGGGLALAGEAVLLDPLRTGLADRCRVVPAPEVVAARFGTRAGVVGAAMLARSDEFPRSQEESAP
jgi:glucokinase